MAGAPPFDGQTALALVSQHRNEVRPRFAGEIARGNPLLDALCDRLMAKRPADRFASYDELLASLEEVAQAWG